MRKAAFVILFLHEFDHFLKRYGATNEDFDAIHTDREIIKIYKTTEDGFFQNVAIEEGGEMLLCSIFGRQEFENLNLNQAEFIINISNWGKNIEKFQCGFMKFKKAVSESAKFMIAENLPSSCGLLRYHWEKE
jgi:hypothetical protein